LSRPWRINETISTEFSCDGKHRFYLKCVWNNEIPGIIYVMLNPSTTDNISCDDTVEKIIEFSIQQGYGSTEIINLFSLIDPNSDNLRSGNNLVLPENRKMIESVIKDASGSNKQIVLAWGGKGYFFNANAFVFKLINDFGIRPYCLGTLKYNQPIHPVEKD